DLTRATAGWSSAAMAVETTTASTSAARRGSQKRELGMGISGSRRRQDAVSALVRRSLVLMSLRHFTDERHSRPLTPGLHPKVLRRGGPERATDISLPPPCGSDRRAQRLALSLFDAAERTLL